MTRLTLHGTPMYTEGTPPVLGRAAPRFLLTDANLTDLGLDHFGRRCKVLLTVPSLELPSCTASARQLEEQLQGQPGIVLVTISPDLPFAGQRLRGDDTPGQTVFLSSFRSPQFARAYGLDIVSGPLKGLLAPALMVHDADHRVVHVELVRELSRAADHAAALAAARQAIRRANATSVASTAVASVAR